MSFLEYWGKDKPCPQGGGLDVDPKPTEEFLHIWTKRTGGLDVDPTPTEDFLHIWTKRTGGLDVEPKPTGEGEEGVSKCKF